MEVKVSEKEGVVIFQIDGEINISTTLELKKRLETHLSKKIVMDLEKMKYIDSSGLAALLEVLKKVKSQGGSLILVGMSDKVKSLFEITKLDKLFLIFRNQAEALSQV